MDGENPRPKKSPITNQNEKNALGGPRKHEVETLKGGGGEPSGGEVSSRD